MTEGCMGMPNYQVVDLERMKLVALQYINDQLMDQFAIEPLVTFHHEWDEVVMRVVQMVYGRTMERIEVKYPANWWEAVKDRWLPEWAKARWPVVYTTKYLDAKELYPKLSAPGYAPHLQLAIMG